MKISDYMTATKDTMAAYNRMCQPLLAQYGLPQVSFDILLFLTNNPTLCTAQDISEYRNIKKNLVSVHVEKLVQAGLLCRGTVSGDRRKIALYCTEQAAAVIRDGLAMQKNFCDALFEGISPQDKETYKRILQTMANNTKKMNTVQDGAAKHAATHGGNYDR